jgi:predicted CXXCH cytochrome family protein
MRLLSLALVLALAAVAAAQSSKAPEIKQDCSLCHISHEMAAGGLLKAPVGQLCLGCHPQRVGATEHVVDVAPSMEVPPELPLRDGLLTCITCHDPHGGEFEAMLRVKPRELCQRCHRF